MTNPINLTRDAQLTIAWYASTNPNKQQIPCPALPTFYQNACLETIPETDFPKFFLREFSPSGVSSNFLEAPSTGSGVMECDSPLSLSSKDSFTLSDDPVLDALEASLFPKDLPKELPALKKSTGTVDLTTLFQQTFRISGLTSGREAPTPDDVSESDDDQDHDSPTPFELNPSFVIS